MVHQGWANAPNYVLALLLIIIAVFISVLLVVRWLDPYSLTC